MRENLVENGVFQHVEFNQRHFQLKVLCNNEKQAWEQGDQISYKETSFLFIYGWEAQGVPVGELCVPHVDVTA